MMESSIKAESIHQGRIIAQYREARHWTQQRLAEELGVDLRTVQRMEQRPMIKNVERRKLLIRLLGIPAALMAVEGELQTSIHTDFLLNADPMSFFEDEVVTHWEVYHIGGTSRAARSLDRWMYEVTSFANSARGTGWHRRAQAVLAMSYQLQGNVQRDQMNFNEAHTAYQQAFRVAQELEDYELMSSALQRDGFIYCHQETPLEAIEYLTGSLKIIQGRGYARLRRQILGALSEAQAKAGLASDCWRTMDVLESAAQQSGHSGDRSSSLFRLIPLIEQKAINATLLGDHHRALALIDKSLTSYDPTGIRGKAKLMGHKAKTYLSLGEIDACVITAKEVVIMARSVGSEKRVAQMRVLYTALTQSKWKNERGVASLGALLATQ
jgi:transcriptional regulator with XRE-family HTH domain